MGTSQPYYLAGALLSLISALGVVIAYWMLPPVRKHPSGIIFYRSLFDIMFSIHMIALFGVDYVPWEISYPNYCGAYAFFFQFCLLGSQTLYFVMVLDMSFAVLINPFGNPRNNMKYYLALTLIMSIVTATVIVSKNTIVYRPGLDICWIEPTNVRSSVNGYNWGMLFGIITFYYFFAITASIVVLIRLSLGSGKIFKTRSQTNERLVYVVVFTAYWTIAGAIYARIYVSESNSSCVDQQDCSTYETNSSLYDAFAFIISVRGLIDAVVWILNQRVIAYALAHYRRKKEKDDTPAVLPEYTLQAADSLSGLQTGYFKPRNRHHSRKRSVTLHEQIQEDLNKVLRSELLHFATSGVCDALDDANSQVRTTVYNPDTHDHLVFEEDSTRPEMLAYPKNLYGEYGICGSREGRSDAAIRRIDVRFSRTSVRQRQSHSFNSSADVTIERGDLVFLDYAPQVFRFMRRKFGINDEELKKSIRGDDFRRSGEERMTELFTEGAGGSFFYFSRDRKYMIKTLTKQEAAFLVKILRPYAEYMSSYPDTLITKFLGFYSVRQTMTLEPLYFVVMQSVFYSVPQDFKIHQRYDLKGSYINRNAKGRSSKSSLLLDNDLKHKLALLPEHRDKFRQQVASDSKFLAALNIMDYSLLIGVHNSIWAASSASRNQTDADSKHARSGSQPFHQTTDGGMEAAYIKGPGVYAVGIIDILQEWDFAKKAEHYFKVYIRRKDREGISAIPPKPYCERFIQSMFNITEADEEDAKELLLLAERQKSDALRSMTVTRISVESRISTKDRLPLSSLPIPGPYSNRSSTNPSPRDTGSPEAGSMRKYADILSANAANPADIELTEDPDHSRPIDSPQLGDRETLTIKLQSTSSDNNVAV